MHTVTGSDACGERKLMARPWTCSRSSAHQVLAERRRICDRACMNTATIGFAVTERVRASNTAVWALLGDFGNEHRWTRTLTHCERDTADVHVGTVRTCTLPKPLMGRTSAREVLTEFDPGVALGYALDGPAGPFLTASSRWSTRPASDGTTLVTVEGTFTTRNWVGRLLLWPLAKPMIKGLARRVVRELGSFATSSQ
jgi:hypothetical protein